MSLNRAGFIAVVLFLSVLSDRIYAGFVTYGFVDRPADQGIYHVTGSITVKDTAISVGSLLSSDVVSYSLSVTHGGTTDFSLTDSNSTLTISDVISITATQIFIPPPSPALNNLFEIDSNPGGGVTWDWNGAPFQEYAGQVLPSVNPLWFETFNAPHFSPFDIAVREPTSGPVPEPSSLVIAMTLSGSCGLVGAWRRRRRRQPQF